MTREQNLSQWKTQFPSLSKFDLAYSPNNWGYAIEHTRNAYLSYTPSLYYVDETFGKGAAAQWVKKQVLGVWVIKPDSDPMISVQAEMWAKVFASSESTSTVGELMLFFARCMSGRYQCGYKFDISRIGTAYEQFKKDRDVERSQYEEIRQQEINEAKAEYNRKYTMTRAEYLAKHGLKETKLTLDSITSKLAEKMNINKQKENERNVSRPPEESSVAEETPGDNAT